MKQLPTAEEFLIKENLPIDILSGDDINYAMIEFAKLHVQAALERAVENTKEWHGNNGMLKQSILDTYSLDNIK